MCILPKDKASRPGAAENGAVTAPPAHLHIIAYLLLCTISRARLHLSLFLLQCVFKCVELEYFNWQVLNISNKKALYICVKI